MDLDIRFKGTEEELNEVLDKLDTITTDWEIVQR